MGKLQFRSKEELKKFVAEQAKLLKDQEFVELDNLIKKVKELLGASGYSIKDLYFRDRASDGTVTTTKAGTYKVGDTEIKWSGMGKRPLLLKGKSNEELKALKVA